MCIILAFTDSELLWGGGVFADGEMDKPYKIEQDVSYFERECVSFSYPSSHF